jgi:hypothetical protein
LNLDPEREAEIVDEVSQHLDDRYQELRVGGTIDADARRLALEERTAVGARGRATRAGAGSTGRPHAGGCRTVAFRCHARAVAE